MITSEECRTSARNRSEVRRSASTAASASVMSREFETTPCTAGTSNMFVKTCSNQRHEPLACRCRQRTRAHMPGVARTTLQRGAQLADVVGMDDLAAVAVDPQRQRMAEDPFVRRREVRHLAVAVDDREEIEAALHEPAEPFLALAERELGVLAIGDVAEVPDEAAHVRVGEQVERDDLGPDPPPSGAADPGLGDARLVGVARTAGSGARRSSGDPRGG